MYYNNLKKTLKPQIATAERKQDKTNNNNKKNSLCFHLCCVSNVCFVVLDVKDKLDIELHTQKRLNKGHKTRALGTEENAFFFFFALLWYP